MADSSGEVVDNKTRLEVIQQQETLIREEAAEKQKEVNYCLSIDLACLHFVCTERGNGGCGSCRNVSNCHRECRGGTSNLFTFVGDL